MTAKSAGDEALSATTIAWAAKCDFLRICTLRPAAKHPGAPTRQNPGMQIPDVSQLSSTLFLAYAAYLAGVASPGPSNLAIMSTAMSRGRAHALALAAGVMSGSLVWGFSAAFGLSALMQAYSWTLVAVKIAGGLYMLWLAWKAARSALSPTPLAEATGAAGGRLRQSYLKGLAMHLTNPKAIFVWLSIVALGLPPDAARGDALMVVGGCAVIALAVFFGYALAFSTGAARSAYRKVHRWFNAALALLFGLAGLRMLAESAA